MQHTHTCKASIANRASAMFTAPQGYPLSTIDAAIELSGTAIGGSFSDDGAIEPLCADLFTT